MEPNQITNIIGYFMTWMMDRDVKPGTKILSVANIRSEVFDHYCQPASNMDDWKNLVKYADGRPETKERVISIINSFRHAAVTPPWDEIFLSTAMFAGIMITEGSPGIMDFVVKRMADNHEEEQIQFCMDLIGKVCSKYEDPSPEMFAAFRTRRTTTPLSTSTPKRVWNSKENTRRLSVSEEVLNITGQLSVHQTDSQNKRQIDNLKSMLITAEEENKDLISDREALVEASKQQEMELATLKRQLDQQSDYEELQKRQKRTAEEVHHLTEENIRLKHCASENEVLKTRCGNYLQQRTDIEAQHTELEKRVETLQRKLLECNDELEEKTISLTKATDEIYRQSVEFDQLVARFHEKDESNRSFGQSRLSSQSSEQSFQHTVNTSGVPFALEMQNDQLKTEVDEKRSAITSLETALTESRSREEMMKNERSEIMNMVEKRREEASALGDKNSKLREDLAAKHTDLLDLRREKSCLEREITEQRELNVTQQNALNAQSEKATELTSQIEGLVNENAAQMTMVGNVENQLSDERTASKTLREENHILVKTCSDTTAKVESLCGDLDIVKETLGKTETGRRSAERVADELKQQLNTAKSDLTELDHKYTTLASELKTETAARQAAQTDHHTVLEKYETAQTELKSAHAEMESKKLQLTETASSLSTELEQTQADNATLHAAVTKSEETCKSQNHQSQLAMEQLTEEHGVKLRQATLQIEEYAVKCTKLQVEKSQLESVKSSLEGTSTATTKRLETELSDQKQKCESDLQSSKDAIKSLNAQLIAQQASRVEEKNNLTIIHKSEIEEHERKRCILDEQLQKANSKRQKMTDHIKKVDEDQKILHERYEAKKAELAAKELEHKNLIRAFKDTESTLKSEIEKESNRADVAKKQTTQSERGLNITLDKMAKLKEEKTMAITEKEKIVVDWKATRERVSYLEEKLKSEESKVQTLTAANSKLSDNLETQKHQNEELSKTNLELQNIDERRSSDEIYERTTSTADSRLFTTVQSSMLNSSVATLSAMPDAPAGNSTLLSEANLKQHNESHFPEMMSTPKRAPLHAPVDEEFGNETINDYQTDLCFTSQVSAVVAKNKAREDFQPNSSGANSDEPDEFKYNRRANNFISERNKKVARHLRSSYALEHDISPVQPRTAPALSGSISVPSVATSGEKDTFKEPETPKSMKRSLAQRLALGKENSSNAGGTKRKSHQTAEEEKPKKSRRRSLRSMLPSSRK